MSDALLDEQFWTYADYKEWELDAGERYELVYGEAYAMAAPDAVLERLIRRNKW